MIHADATLNRAELQSVLFVERPSRLAILGCDCKTDDAAVSRRMRVNVWRNHAIEPVLALAQPYAFWGRYHADFFLGDYDDSLMFAGHREADVELLWIDSSRYDAAGGEAWLEWLETRLSALRASSRAPVVIATWLNDDAMKAGLERIAQARPGVYFADLAQVCADAGVRLLDMRTAAMAGTPLASGAQIVIAKALACLWLPGAALPPIKAIAFDLDHTLHAGVLGEDGIDGVRLEAGHTDLQNFARSLRDRGVFLALVSRNEASDVETLFRERTDYPLRWNDFSVTRVSWGDKAVALAQVAQALRIGADAMLFVDDNPGEIANVAAQLPDMPSVAALSDTSLTLRALQHFPGLWRWRVEADDGKRIRDLEAESARVALREKSGDAGDYFRSLDVRLTYRFDAQEQLGRLADLCRKTNQFNLALRRMPEAELEALMQSASACVASVQLSDRLSDSGVIAVIVGQREDDRLVVEEVCMSCRALGRQLEDTIVARALRAMPFFDACREVVFRTASGPRNQPALDWLSKFMSAMGQPDESVHAIARELLDAFAVAEGVQIVMD